MAQPSMAEKEQNKTQSSAMRVPSINDVKIAGRLGQDPVIRTPGENQIVANMSVALNSRKKDGKGEWHERTDFIPVVVWGKAAEYARDKFKKGSAVYVEGRLKENSWEKDGVKHRTIQIEASKIQALSKSQGKEAELER